MCKTLRSLNLEGRVVAAIEINALVLDVQDRVDHGIEKVTGIIFCFGEAAGAIFYGAYGAPANMSILTIVLILAQLTGAGFVVILLDDMLRKGYGLGSGISLFIVANTS